MSPTISISAARILYSEAHTEAADHARRSPAIMQAVHLDRAAYWRESWQRARAGGFGAPWLREWALESLARARAVRECDVCLCRWSPAVELEQVAS